MGLKTKTIRKALDAGFKALGELVISATYRRTTSVYTPSTGQMTKTNTDYTIRGVKSSFSNYEIDRVVVTVGDLKFVVQNDKMPVTPVIATDTLILLGKTYNIVRAITDPSNSVLILHLRSPS